MTLSFVTFRVTAALLLSAVAVVLAALNTALYFSVDRRDPIQSALQTEALNSPVAPGGELIVRITRDKVRSDCSLKSERVYVSEDGEKVPALTEYGVGGSPDDSYIDFAYTLPDELTPGQWELRAALEYQCPGGVSFDHQQEPVRFRVSE